MSSVFHRLFSIGFVAITVLFAVAAFILIAFAGIELWLAVGPSSGASMNHRFDSILQSVAMLTIALACLELADTVVQDEFAEEGRLDVTLRIRRVLARFLVVVIVSLSIEALVAVFKFVNSDGPHVEKAAFIAVAAAALLAGWGVFTRLDRRAGDA